jgi:DNA-binding transcriptional regulator/RsmH inhibitor MraZ
MALDIELVEIGRSGEIKIPRRFRHRGASIRGEYVVPRLADSKSGVLIMPVDAWEYITKDLMSRATSSAEARRLRRASKPWVRLTIDRYGRLRVPMDLRRRTGIGRKVTLLLINDVLELRPEAEFESALEHVRWTNAELETNVHALTAEPVAAHAQTGSRARHQAPSTSRVRAERIPQLAADELEAFVRDCFWQMGFRCVQVGRTRQADGGVDLSYAHRPFTLFPIF